jgi:lactoylglutathione lyase
MISHLQHSEIILFVNDEQLSAKFYAALFRTKPAMIAPGMVEFVISDSLKLGLMPASGIAKIIEPILPHPNSGSGIPRCELYFLVDDVDFEMDHALICGAKLVNEIADRDWGDRVGYVADPDGHVIAFAKRL